MKRYAVVFFGGIAAAWAIGLILFVANIRTLQEPRPIDSLQAVDAIVVLTGGSERLSAGIDLLKAHKGKKLFISGVHPGLTLDRLFANQLSKELHDCCVVLGHDAESTHGNAEETLIWMTMENFHSMRLVTANYHMPRSLFLFHAAMPDIAIVPHPVSPDKVVLDGWWERPGTASLLVTEYNKYLWANLRLLLDGA